MKILRQIVLALVFLTSATLSAQEELTRILFIFDGSNSMNAVWQENQKIVVAKRLLEETLDELKDVENLEVALRMYGHQTRIAPGNQDCSDTKLEVPFSSDKNNINRIKNKIRGLEPKGTTPIARSLEYAAEDFPECSNCRNVIILITDGIEACDEDPCAVSRALRSKGIKLKPFVVGLGLDTSYLNTFGCIGEYLSVETEEAFEPVLNFIIDQALNNTTAQVNLYNVNKKAKETDVTMSFYDQKSGELLHTYMHTLNRNQLPDTISLNPVHTYKLVVHTTPEVIVENIKLTAGIHNIVEADAPTGKLDLRIQGSDNLYTGVKCIVRKSGDMKTVNIQDFNHEHRYLVGTYDLEILTLPRLYMNEVKINQSRSSTITIPQYGTLEVRKGSGPGAIFEQKNGQNIWVCNLPDETVQRSINLLPGKYLISYRSSRTQKTAHTMLKEIKITPLETQNINL